MRHLWLLVVLLLVSGCASGVVDIPLDSMTTEASRTNLYTTVGDASTAKEAIVHKSWQNYHDEYGKAYKTMGFNMTFEPVEGVAGAIRLASISFKPEIKMATPPDKPSEHPVWNTVNTVVEKGIAWAGIGYIAHEFRGMQESAYDAAGNTYNGDTQMSGSYNTAGNDQTITTGQQRVDNSTRTDSDGCSNGDCNEGSEEEIEVDGSCGEGSFEEDGTWWIETGCSCDSRAAGDC